MNADYSLCTYVCNSKVVYTLETQTFQLGTCYTTNNK